MQYNVVHIQAFSVRLHNGKHNTGQQGVRPVSFADTIWGCPRGGRHAIRFFSINPAALAVLRSTVVLRQESFASICELFSSFISGTMRNKRVSNFFSFYSLVVVRGNSATKSSGDKETG